MIEDVVDWVEVDESRYNDAKNVPSLVIEMDVSPYDVPHQVRGTFDDKQRKFVIEFRYIDDEEVRQMKLEEHVNALVGKKSGRVYALTVDVEAIGVDSVALKMGRTESKQSEAVRKDVSDALGSMDELLRNKLFRPKRREKNYKVANKVLGDYWQSISRTLAAG